MRLRSFIDFCASQQIYLLRDDVRFIDDALNYFLKNEQKRILERYIQEWHKGIEMTENEAKKQNLGRRAANNWLREEVEGRKRIYVP